MIKLRLITTSEWTEVVLADFDRFLIDHAAAEKKAAGMAISMLSHYPDRPELVAAMAGLVVEETTHFRDVLRIMHKHGIQGGRDEKDGYVNRFRQCILSGSSNYLLDRLLVGGIIEARGCERFAMIGDAIGDPALARFYTGIGRSEARHAHLFVELAQVFSAMRKSKNDSESCWKKKRRSLPINLCALPSTRVFREMDTAGSTVASRTVANRKPFGTGGF